MKEKYKIGFIPAYPPYQKEDEYTIYTVRENLGGIKIKQTIFKAKTRKECEEKLKELLKGDE